MFGYFSHCIFERYIIRVAEQSMVTTFLHARTGGDVFEISITSLHSVNIGIQCHGDKLRGFAKGRTGTVVAVFEQFLCVWIVLE